MTSLATNTKAQIADTVRMREDLFIGPSLGLGSTWVNHMIPAKKFKLGGTMGISFLYAWSSNLALGADLVVSVEGYKISNIENKLSTQSTTPLYLRLPLRVCYMIGDGRLVRPMIFAGPVLGYKIAEYGEDNKVSGGMFLRQNSNEFRTFDAGVSGGAGVMFRFSDRTRLNVSLNYYYGLTDALQSYYRYNQIENFTANIGMLFALR
jgi:hypothetical protein